MIGRFLCLLLSPLLLLLIVDHKDHKDQERLHWLHSVFQPLIDMTMIQQTQQLSERSLLLMYFSKSKMLIE